MLSMCFKIAIQNCGKTRGSLWAFLVNLVSSGASLKSRAGTSLSRNLAAGGGGGGGGGRNPGGAVGSLFGVLGLLTRRCRWHF